MLVQAREEAQSAKGQVEAIRGDNLALLERLKYVQGYQSQSRPRKSKPICCAVLFALCMSDFGCILASHCSSSRERQPGQIGTQNVAASLVKLSTLFMLEYKTHQACLACNDIKP